MLLSDRDIRSEIQSGRVAVEPFDEAMIQPSSVDVRLDKFFRVFENHKYSVIDPSIEQAELTREVIAEGVETAAHGALLLEMGCEMAQGYAFARPMPGADMPTWIMQ